MKPALVLTAAVVFLILFLVLTNSRSIVKELPKMPSLILWKIIYTDTYCKDKKNGTTYGKILYSEKYDIQGKPDFIYQNRLTGELMPVEIKSGTTEEIHEGDMLQIGAYLLIVEDIYNIRPKKTIVSYKNKSFVVKNTRFLRELVLDTANRMRHMLLSGEEEPNADFVTCRPCVCNGTVCEFSEADLEDR